MSNLVIFDVDGTDEAFQMEDVSVPAMGAEVSINDQTYRVLSTVFSYWTERPGDVMANVRIEPVDPAAEPQIY